MSSILKDGTGKGFAAKVNNKGELWTRSTNVPLQHEASMRTELSYQVSSEMSISATEQNMLLIKNNDPDKNIVVTYIRVASIDADAASASQYFTIKVGGDVTAGNAIAATNVFIGSTLTPNAEFYDGNGTAITTSGTFDQLDKTFAASNDEMIYRKEGSLIIPKGQSLLITHKGSSATGMAYARVSFFFMNLEG